MKDPSTLGIHAQLDEAAARRDWRATRVHALKLAIIAERHRDVRLLEETGIILATLGELSRSAHLRLTSRRLGRKMKIQEWIGQDISGRTLLIDLMETEKQGLGMAIRSASLVAEAVKRARRCIVIVEQRLVPLFRRTFPLAEIISRGPVATKAYSQADLCAGFQHITAQFATDAARLEKSFTPLAVDKSVTMQLRQKYESEAGLPLVGISWTSAAFKKASPEIDDWKNLFSSLDANFVSLQYGKIDQDLEKLRSFSGKKILYNSSVDQLVDMDRFAAQEAALDAIITVSNSGAHLSGALGVPTVIIIEDKIRNWPMMESRTPYYPSVKLVHRNGRKWADVIDEASQKLKSILLGEN